MSFTKWLLGQQKRQDAIGDLARDAKQDKTWPRGDRGLSEYAQHLAIRGACDGARDTLLLAWEEWMQYPCCDFCNDEPVTATFRLEHDPPLHRREVRGVTILTDPGPTWHACAVCEKLIREGDREGLADRAVTRYKAAGRIASHLPAEKVRPFLELLLAPWFDADLQVVAVHLEDAAMRLARHRRGDDHEQ